MSVCVRCRLYVDRDSISRFNKLQALVRAIRNARAEYKVRTTTTSTTTTRYHGLLTLTHSAAVLVPIS